MNSIKKYSDAMEELDVMVGLEGVKKRIYEVHDLWEADETLCRENNDSLYESNLHGVFKGDAGSGKTKVANLYAQILFDLDRTSSEIPYVIDATDFDKRYYSDPEKTLGQILSRATDKVLIIDHLESLAFTTNAQGGYQPSFFDGLRKLLDMKAFNYVLVLLGGNRAIEKLFRDAPDLKQRFGLVCEFNDYSIDELVGIIELRALQRRLLLDNESQNFLRDRIRSLWMKEKSIRGNARFALFILDEAIKRHATVLHHAKDDLAREYLKLEDFKDCQVWCFKDIDAFQIPDTSEEEGVDEVMLAEALSDLNQLSGLQALKQDMIDLVDLTRYYRSIGKALTELATHMVFLGNPGTGKTTFARLVAKIYRALGLLGQGHLVECDRADLVAKYIGQTAVKTDEKIQEAMGGILFIDEAYSLSSRGSEMDFGPESIETLLKRMEDLRGKFIVIVAGYTRNMKEFLESNPGLKSRFEVTYTFEDFTCDELMKITKRGLARDELILSDEAEHRLMDYFAAVLRDAGETFGNARDVRTLVRKIVQQHHLRLARSGKTKTGTEANVIGVFDLDWLEIPSLPFYSEKSEAKTFGFRV